MGVVLRRRAERKDHAVIKHLHQGKMHISALAAAVYGTACRRNELRVMRTIARLRRGGVRIVYDKRQRMYMLAG